MEQNQNVAISEQDGDIVQMSEVEIVASEKASYDIQIATAKKFPRNIKRALNNSISIVTMDKETAASCEYALPRSGSTIRGKSIHLARILLQQWGNIRAESKVIGSDAVHVTSEAICFDLETNVAVKCQVKRKILDRNGRRYNEDMITMTGNAGSSIALRNAIYNIIPVSVSENVAKAARQCLTGDISDKNKFIAKRKEVIDALVSTYGLTEKQVCDIMNVATIEAIADNQQLLDLIGLGTSLKDRVTTVEELLSKGTNSKPADKNFNAALPKNDLAPDKSFDNATTKTTPPQTETKKEDVKPANGKLM